MKGYNIDEEIKHNTKTEILQTQISRTGNGSGANPIKIKIELRRFQCPICLERIEKERLEREKQKLAKLRLELSSNH